MKDLQVKFQTSSQQFTNQALVVFAQQGEKLDLRAINDSFIVGKIEEAYQLAQASSNFSAKKSSKLLLHGVISKTSLLIVGVNKEAKEEETVWVELGGGVAKALGGQKFTSVSAIFSPSVLGKKATDHKLGQFALGFMLGNYRFDHYFSADSDRRSKVAKLDHLMLVAEEVSSETEILFKTNYLPVAKGVIKARNLGNEPANIMTTQKMVEACLSLKYPGLTIKVLAEEELAALKMNSLLAVGQGSAQDSYAVFMSWQGREGKDTDLAVLGKGVVFDSGGISLKPSRRMEEMKFDMCGAGAVIGLIQTLAERKAPVNVLGVVGLVENMPSAKAQRPGDIVTSMSGQTIEVTNTDAEGRMVLADLITCTQLHYKPKTMVDMATLTGSIIVALGSKYAGLFTNSELLSKQIETASSKVGEKLWNMPMDEKYDEAMDSKVADVLNAESSHEAGSITAAKFLQRFVDEDVLWAHIDIAGPATTEKPSALSPVGATGYGVRLLNQLIISNFEN